ncbi:MAG TPA: protein kinase [Steroidobacteraceae bacterium]|nr:protein kinase [Steroidobacteraceae bacterium]
MSTLAVIEGIFHAALALPPEQVDEFLELSCAGDASLRQQVELLLQSHRQADRFIEEPLVRPHDSAPEPDDSDRLIGQLVGQYRILQRLGGGGMGVVYLAQRADQQYEKRVAIKLIKRGMDTDSVLRHFHMERQILATFDHPNIAHLLDGGATEDGRPYFVMEYVQGVPVDVYCDAKKLSITERLQLFRQICGAVTYAHRHAVIHRDLKPSNILVDSDGVPKLLDFGIAKVLQPGEYRESVLTMLGLRMMTPDYASPEQVRGEALTTASDVYSLGVVLYKLLTGSQPYDLPRTSHDISRAITETEPRRPSAVAGSAERWARGLRGDLDNIVLMALRKEPERRYQSVERFSDDIRRHLESLPVLARQDAFGYRALKFVQRNKAATAAAALVALSLLGGIVATSWQAQKAKEQEAIAKAQKARAEQRFSDVRRLAHSVLFEYYDAIENLPGSTAAREMLVKNAITYLDSLAGEASDDKALQLELAAAYDRVGDVHGRVFSAASLGDRAGALNNYMKASRIREAIVASDPHDERARTELAGSYITIGSQLQETNELPRGVQYVRKGIAEYVKALAENPADMQIRNELARAYNNLGLALEETGDAAGSMQNHREALQLREALVAAEPANGKYQRNLAVSYINLGRAQVLTGALHEGLASNQGAMTLCTALLANDARNADYRRLLSNTYQNDGEYRDFLGDSAGALASFRKKLALDAQSMADDPLNAAAREDFGYANARIGDLLAESGANAQALPYRAKALALFERMAADSPESVIMRYRTAILRAGVGEVQAKLGRRDIALRHSAQAVAELDAAPADPAVAWQGALSAQALMLVGHTYAALDDRGMACKSYGRSFALWQGLEKRGILTADVFRYRDEVARQMTTCPSGH